MWNTPNPLKFAEAKLGVELDEWQREWINTKGNTAVRAGRQSGKSFAESLRVALFALLNPKTQTLIIGSVERQSFELFEKVQAHIYALAKTQVKGRPTMHKIELRNGSTIRAEPAGRTGAGLRGFTCHKIVIDEAHYVPEEVFVALQPMLATTDGTIDLLSTPRGNKGFFYECFNDPEYTTFHVKSEDCPRISKQFLESQKRNMTKLQYAQEYEAEFLDSLQQFFPRELIDQCIGEPTDRFSTEFVLGVDVARYGGDENAFIIMKYFSDNKKMEVIEKKTTSNVDATHTFANITLYNNRYNLKKVYIDDGGVGGPILDFMLKDSRLKRKAVGINNASRSLDADEKQRKKILKEDLYGNLKMLMEQKRITIPDDEEIIRSLLSIQFEYNEETGRVKIWGSYSHLAEALNRAAWYWKSKGLNIRAFC